MASPVPSHSDLSNAITGILKETDLAALSSKKVRKQLETEFSMDLTSRKQELDELLMTLINDQQKQVDDGPEAQSSTDESDGESEEETKPTPSKAATSAPKKRPVKVAPKRPAPKDVAGSSSGSDLDEVDDEDVARKLQKEEFGRPTRSVKTPAKPRRAKSEKKHTGEKARKGSTYSRECVLSEDLAAFFDKPTLPRCDVVAGMWKYIKGNDLQDPKNKQFVICDAKLEPIFKTKRFKGFSMMKYLSSHIKDSKLINT